jgi:hypothetical protein
MNDDSKSRTQEQGGCRGAQQVVEIFEVVKESVPL